MATLTIEGVPPSLLLRLTGVAAAKGHCINTEVILTLARHLREELEVPGRELPGARRCGQARSEVPPGLNVPWGDPDGALPERRL